MADYIHMSPRAIVEGVDFDRFVRCLPSADVRVNETFVAEDLAAVAMGKVVFPDQTLELDSGGLRVATGPIILDLDAQGQVINVYT